MSGAGQGDLVTVPIELIAKKNFPLLAASVLVLLGVGIYGKYLQWNGLGFTVKVTDMADLLAPLAFAAAVIERAVEILVSPWRDEAANNLEHAMADIKARPADPARGQQNAADLKSASGALNAYRGETQRYAFGVSLTLSLLTSIAGIRVLEPFVDAAKLHAVSSAPAPATPHAQQIFFLCLDVTLSAALLAGGADGVHSVVNAFTSFFDRTTEKKP